jgi:hypothetical protein
MGLGVTAKIPGDFNLFDERLVRKAAKLGLAGIARA